MPKKKKEKIKYVIPYCGLCGEKMKVSIIPIGKFYIHEESVTGTFWNDDNMPDWIINSKKSVKEREIFDDVTGERLYEKIIYCKNKCKSEIVDKGTYREIIKNKKTSCYISIFK